ncbi:hypothetical protein LEMLEM_LOCUS24592, partial [Lemmus lemmus]
PPEAAGGGHCRRPGPVRAQPPTHSGRAGRAGGRLGAGRTAAARDLNAGTPGDFSSVGLRTRAGRKGRGKGGAFRVAGEAKTPGTSFDDRWRKPVQSRFFPDGPEPTGRLLCACAEYSQAQPRKPCLLVHIGLVDLEEAGPGRE